MLHPVNRLSLEESHLRHMLQQFLHMALTVMKLLAGKIFTLPQVIYRGHLLVKQWQARELSGGQFLSVIKLFTVNKSQNNPNVFSIAR